MAVTYGSTQWVYQTDKHFMPYFKEASMLKYYPHLGERANFPSIYAWVQECDKVMGNSISPRQMQEGPFPYVTFKAKTSNLQRLSIHIWCRGHIQHEDFLYMNSTIWFSHDSDATAAKLTFPSELCLT